MYSNLTYLLIFLRIWTVILSYGRVPGFGLLPALGAAPDLPQGTNVTSCFVPLLVRYIRLYSISLLT